MMKPRGPTRRLLTRCTAWCVICAVAITGGSVHAAAPEKATYDVGLAKIDITPEGPIRLSGFSFRKTESIGVRQRIYARAMAVRAGGQPAILITVDSIGIPPALRDEVARRLRTKRHIPNERLSICSTHSHTTPSLSGILPSMFGEPVPPEHQQRIDRYTSMLTDRIEQAAMAALDDLRASRMSFGVGEARFAVNRRTRGGPVDHDLPVMAVVGPDGKIRGVYLSYACHCVVLSDYKVSGDWAGYAAEDLEKKYPGAVALVSIGCGADADPESGVTGDRGEVAHQYGTEIATEADRVLRSDMADVDGELHCEWDTIRLALQALPTRDEWVQQSKQEGPGGYYASLQLAAIDRREQLPTQISYAIQTWKFGDSLAMVFLPGEVVVDYSLRLKKDFDDGRLFVNAYANDCPAYIPSERILKEGGYEGGGAMLYYGLPAPFAPGLEDKIISTIAEQLGEEFKKPEKQLGTQGILPKSPLESLATMRVRDDLKVELVASEPQIRDPVAIDFGPDGKLWVAEMIDYGCKDGENCPPLGRITVLEDRDADGQYEHATRFLEQIAMPMGVTVWRKGVLICAAPDILYAEDTTGDGKADVVKKLFSGFGVGNAQARVNGFAYGLDGWLYAACSFGGSIRSHLRSEEFSLADTDFRLKPDSGVLEPETGRTQQGRVRDDWGNWFGCNNSVLCLHFPLPERYLRRNRHVVPPSLSVSMATEEATKLFPRGELVLFELSGPAGRPTAVCGLGVYRDDALGPEFNNNLFVCEPVNQLVHRMVPRPAGATFIAERAPEETESEFLTSTDQWFRPVQARTGPDGALWIVDMYRYVIEHSRWIPPQVLEKLDVRAGSSLGRIYRVVRQDAPRRPPPRLETLDSRQLAAAIDSANGWQRDMVQQLIVWRQDKAAAEPLADLAAKSPRPATRLQALCTLDLLGKLSDAQIEQAFADAHPGVRRQAVRLAEDRLNTSYELTSAVIGLAEERDASVASQLACTLGEMNDAEAVTAPLVKIARQHAEDPYIVSAILTSVADATIGDVIRELMGGPPGKTPTALLEKLAELAGTTGNQQGVEAALDAAAHVIEANREAHRFSPLAALFSGLYRGRASGQDFFEPASAERVRALVDQSARVAKQPSADLTTRVDCIRVVGRTPLPDSGHIRLLSSFLTAEHAPELQQAAVDGLALRADDEVAEELLKKWSGFTPSVRSRVLDVLLSSESWCRALLDAIRNQTVPASEIDAAHRARLADYPDREVRELAKKSLSQSSAGERAAVVARYRESQLEGDPARGKTLFEKHCATCHEFRGTGSRVGPDLAALEDKSRGAMLRETFDPNRAVDGRYAEYVAITTSGQVKNGILSQETGNAITLRGQQGEETTLLRSELDSLTSTGKSLMPEGFENQISPQDMADLLEFLSTP